MERVLEPVIDIPAVKRPPPKRYEQTRIEPSWPRIRRSKRKSLIPEPLKDRPKWIPDHILDDWDPDPYAYQTEEDLMPAGGRHGAIVSDIRECTNGPLQERNLMTLVDIFVLFRDKDNLRDRNAPDLLVVPCKEGETEPSSYNLETDPRPLCAFEVISPSSKVKDEDSPYLYIDDWGIPCCVLIEQVDKDGDLLDRIYLSVWEQNPDTGLAVEAQPDAEGKFWLAGMNMWIGSEGHSIYFIDGETGERLHDAQTERVTRKAEQERAESERERAESERERAESERERAASAESEVERLQASLLQDKRNMLMLVLNQKFSDLPETVTNQVEQADGLEQLEKWFVQALTADSWQSIFKA